MLRSWSIAETEDDILQARGLRCRPMDPVYADVGGGAGCIEYQVPNLPVENVGRIETQTPGRIGSTSWLILITVDQCKCSEIRSSSDSR